MTAVAQAISHLAEVVEGEVTTDASLADLTTLRVGGPAAVRVDAETEADLVAVGRVCQETGLPWAVVGRGSNLLVADDGFAGIVITLGRGFRGVEVVRTTPPDQPVPEGTRVLVVVGGAEPLPTLARTLADEGLGGMAWAAGVPGSLGGAVRMNAGAHGGEIKDTIVEADIVRLRSGSRETWPAAALGLTYRHADLPDDAVVVGALFALPAADPDTVQAEVDQVRSWRREHQPINRPNCGSVFTNPPGDSAGRLIEDIGAKGLRVGGAQVSELHANFIVTEPGATAADVRALVRDLRRRVHEEHGILLRPELAMLGEFDDDGWDVP